MLMNISSKYQAEKDETYNTLSCAPFGETFHSGPVGIISRNIGHNYTHGLNVLCIHSPSALLFFKRMTRVIGHMMDATRLWPP